MFKRASNVVTVCAAVIAAAVGTGCDDIRTVVVPTETTVTVPAPTILGNPLLPAQAFPADLLGDALAESIAQSISTEGYDKDAVDSLKLTGMSATVVRPNEGNNQVRGLGFLQSLDVFLAAPGGEPILVANSEDGAFDGQPGPVSYTFPVSGAELVDAFNAGDSLDMSADVVPSDPPNFDTEVRFTTEVTILVNVLGAIN
jgi:hypothetical protein